MAVSFMAARIKLLTWYRVLPLCIAAVFGVISFGYSFGPSLLFKAMYPLHYEEDILEAASEYGVDPYLVAAVINTESGWDERALSHSGAMGLMQLMPDTARDISEKGLIHGDGFSPDDLYDSRTNIEFGCAYLSYLLGYFNGATDKAIAAYNAGMGNVDDWVQQDATLHSAITFPETQAYLVRVSMARTRYEELYPRAFS